MTRSSTTSRELCLTHKATPVQIGNGVLFGETQNIYEWPESNQMPIFSLIFWIQPCCILVNLIPTHASQVLLVFRDFHFEATKKI